MTATAAPKQMLRKKPSPASTPGALRCRAAWKATQRSLLAKTSLLIALWASPLLSLKDAPIASPSRSGRTLRTFNLTSRVFHCSSPKVRR